MASLNGKRAAAPRRNGDSGPLSTKKGTTALRKGLEKLSLSPSVEKGQTEGRPEEEWNLPLVLDREELVRYWRIA